MMNSWGLHTFAGAGLLAEYGQIQIVSAVIYQYSDNKP